MNLSSMPPRANSVAGHGAEYVVQQRREALGRQALREPGRIADVGEQHGQLALLAAEPQQRRIADHEVDQVGAQIVFERAADQALLALADQVAVGQHGEIDEGERRKRQEQVEPQAEPDEGQHVGGDETGGDQQEGRAGARHAAPSGGPADQHAGRDHGGEVDQHARLAAQQEVAAQDAVDHRRVALDLGHQAGERRDEAVAEAGGGAADQRDPVREQGRGLAAQHGRGRDDGKAARPVVVDRQAHALVGRHEALAERDALAEHQPDAVAADAELPAGDLERERGQVVGAVGDHRILEALRAAAVERRVDVAEPGRRLAQLGDRREHAVGGRRLAEAGRSALLHDAEGGIGDEARQRCRRRGVRPRLEQDRQHHVARAPRLGREPAIALGARDQRGQARRGVGLLQQRLQRVRSARRRAPARAAAGRAPRCARPPPRAGPPGRP